MSFNIKPADLARSKPGAVTPAAAIVVAERDTTLVAAALRVIFADTGSCFFQIHDAKVGDALSDDTMLCGGGWPIDDGEFTDWMLDNIWVRCDRGITVATSSTRLTFTASALLIVATGTWAV